jgi:hypothetical protein
MKNKSLYAAALNSELHDSESIAVFCDLLGGIEPAFAWMHEEHTEQEIIVVLRKLGYEIPATVVGSATKKYRCDVRIQ